MSSYELLQNMGLLQLLKSQFLCHLIICYVFLVSGLIVNLLQLCTLPVWLVSKQLARRINIRLAYCISSRMYNLSCTITTWLFPRSMLLGEETFSFSGAVGVMLWQPSAARVPRTLYCMASFHKSNPGALYSHVPVCVFVLRDGCYLGVVVWDRVHTLHWPKELSTVWKRECHCGSQPRFWDRLPVWLDLLWEIWSSWGKWK